MKYLTFFLGLGVAIHSWSSPNFSSIEANLVAIEFYDTSGEYALRYRLCKKCPTETIRLSNDINTTLNSSPSTIQKVYSIRHKLKKQVAYYWDRQQNIATHIHVVEED